MYASSHWFFFFFPSLWYGQLNRSRWVKRGLQRKKVDVAGLIYEYGRPTIFGFPLYFLVLILSQIRHFNGTEPLFK